MKKAVICNKIYLDFEESLYYKIKEELTYTLPPKVYNGPPQIIKLFQTIGKELVISIPSGRVDLIPEDYTVIDKRTSVPAVFPEFKFTLRDDQQEIYDLVEGSCLINANPSWGKTFTGISIARKLGQRTLVVVHTTLLRDQWVTEIEKTLGIKPGLISGGNQKYTNEPIVVANIQSLTKFTNAVNKDFGTILVDEVHHAPSDVFSKTLQMFHARNKIGLSGTLERKDFLHVTLTDYFSPEVFKADRSNQLDPTIHMYKTPIKLNTNAMVPWARKINELMENIQYREIVYGLADAYANKGYKVLVVADRVEFLEMGAEIVPKAVVVTGKVTNTEEREALLDSTREQNNVIFGTISIFKEGINRPHWDCIILATPINNDPMLEQLVGRVQRIQEGKKDPIVVDLLLKGNTATRQARARAAFYKKRNWEIVGIQL